MVVYCRFDQDWLRSCWEVEVLVPVYNSLHAALFEAKVVPPYTVRPFALGHSFRHEDSLGEVAATMSTTTRSTCSVSRTYIGNGILLGWRCGLGNKGASMWSWLVGLQLELTPSISTPAAHKPTIFKGF